MGFSKNDFEKVDLRIKKITEQTVEQIEVDSELPPTIEQLEDNNKTYSIMAAILFIDICKSTYLTENSQAKSMVKIYRSFMRMAVDCVRKNGGVTRQFLGDRIMGVFIDSIDENGSMVDSAADKAINAARSLQTVIDYSLNKYLKTNVNGKVIECGIGIDYGKVLVTQVGMYGLESDENRENEVDCVWVGNTTNYASKYSDIASGGEIFISDNVFKQMSDEYREVFVKSAKYKGTKLFQGYVTKDYYLEFSEDLGKPIKIEEDTTVESDTFEGLADGIREIERLQDKLIQREKQLAVLEDKLKKENQDYRDKYKNENTAKLRAFDERNIAEEELQKIRKDYYIDITALDYDRTAKTTKQFFAKVQNKMHYAVHGHTAAELIYERADADKPHMGLTTWAAAPEGKIVKSDVSVAKNYLSEQEMRSLERIVSAYLDLAEDRAERHIPMTMEDWAKRLDLFLMADDREVLQDTGKITAEIAKAKAETEFEKYRVIQDRLFMSDFDKYMLELEENAKK